MLKINLQRPPESHFGSRAQKCSKSASRGRLRAISGAGRRILKISLQKLPESHFGCSFWLLLAGAGRHKPGNPWFEQLLMRKHEVFHDLTNFTQKNSRIFARVALICQLYEGNLRLTSILTAFLRGSQTPGCDTGIRPLP